MRYIQLTTQTGEAYILTDYTKKDFWALLQAWTMFRRPYPDDTVLSPAYIEDGKVLEL